MTDFLKKDAGSRAKFRVRIKNLARINRIHWTDKHFKYIHSGIYEIKWIYGKKQWRALGFDHEDGAFVVVRGCTHKDGVYDPPDWIDRAVELKNQIKIGKWNIIDYVI